MIFLNLNKKVINDSKVFTFSLRKANRIKGLRQTCRIDPIPTSLSLFCNPFRMSYFLINAFNSSGE